MFSLLPAKWGTLPSYWNPSQGNPNYEWQRSCWEVARNTFSERAGVWSLTTAPGPTFLTPDKMMEHLNPKWGRYLSSAIENTLAKNCISMLICGYSCHVSSSGKRWHGCRRGLNPLTVELPSECLVPHRGSPASREHCVPFVPALDVFCIWAIPAYQ